MCPLGFPTWTEKAKNKSKKVKKEKEQNEMDGVN